jgi:uncharacterized protein (DUF2062 family)
MHYTIIFWGIQLVVAGLIAIAVRRPAVGARGLLLAISAMPVAICLLWGFWFRVEPGTKGASSESFVANAPLGFALLSLLIAIGLPFVMRGARVLAAIVVLLELFCTLVVALLAVMQVTGSWI